MYGLDWWSSMAADQIRLDGLKEVSKKMTDRESQIMSEGSLVYPSNKLKWLKKSILCKCSLGRNV